MLSRRDRSEIRRLLEKFQRYEGAWSEKETSRLRSLLNTATPDELEDLIAEAKASRNRKTEIPESDDKLRSTGTYGFIATPFDGLILLFGAIAALFGIKKEPD